MSPRRLALLLPLLFACAREAPGERLQVPAGRYRLGGDKPPAELLEKAPSPGSFKAAQLPNARADEAWRALATPAREVTLPAFTIDRTEVTNRQYRRFLAESTGHARCHPDEPKGKDHTPRYYRDFHPLLARPDYAQLAPFGPQSFTHDDQPVVGVDWWDAWAYAAWAGGRLPSADEWEAACRGTDGRGWPWGNEWAWGLANTGGEKHGRDVPGGGFEKDGFVYPAPVGSFPKGTSPVGCVDLAGNAAEWVADEAPGGARLIRGGSSRSVPSGVRCGATERNEPAFRAFWLGFRCVGGRG